MVQVILFALRALESAAKKSAAKADKKQAKYKRRRAAKAKLKLREADKLRAAANKLILQADRLKWEAGNHAAAAAHGNVRIIRHRRQATELSSAIAQITVR